MRADLYFQHEEAEQLQHVYTSAAQGNVLSHLGTKFLLPIGTTRQDDGVSVLGQFDFVHSYVAIGL